MATPSLDSCYCTQNLHSLLAAYLGQLFPQKFYSAIYLVLINIYVYIYIFAGDLQYKNNVTIWSFQAFLQTHISIYHMILSWFCFTDKNTHTRISKGVTKKPRVSLQKYNNSTFILSHTEKKYSQPFPTGTLQNTVFPSLSQQHTASCHPDKEINNRFMILDGNFFHFYIQGIELYILKSLTSVCFVFLNRQIL